MHISYIFFFQLSLCSDVALIQTDLGRALFVGFEAFANGGRGQFLVLLVLVFFFLATSPTVWKILPARLPSFLNLLEVVKHRRKGCAKLEFCEM